MHLQTPQLCVFDAFHSSVNRRLSLNLTSLVLHKPPHLLGSMSSMQTFIFLLISSFVLEDKMILDLLRDECICLIKDNWTEEGVTEA